MNITLIVYLIWFSSEIFINRMMRSKMQDQPNKDKKSLLLIWVTICVAITAAVVVSMYCNCPVSNNKMISFVGLFIILAGVVFRIAIIRSLGPFFTADVTIRENHILKKDGFYKYLRHPSYFASLLSFIGFGIALNNWISLFLIFTAMFSVFVYRINVEEQALTQHFGAAYTAYKKQTKAILPFIY